MQGQSAVETAQQPQAQPEAEPAHRPRKVSEFSPESRSPPARLCAAARLRPLQVDAVREYLALIVEVGGTRRWGKLL